MTTDRYSELQLDAFRELANIGSGNAATALSSMLGTEVEIDVPRALLLPLDEAVDAIGPRGDEVVVVMLGLEGSVPGMVLMALSMASATELCALLGVDVDDDMGTSALGEIGNIVGCSYVNALAAMTGLDFEPQPPHVTRDLLGAIITSVLAPLTGDDFTAMFLDSHLTVEGAEAEMAFLFVAEPVGLESILQSIGLADT